MRAVAAIQEAFPGLPVLSGSALQPTLREFERTAYAVLNAYAVEAVAARAPRVSTVIKADWRAGATDAMTQKVASVERYLSDR